MTKQQELRKICDIYLPQTMANRAQFIRRIEGLLEGKVSRCKTTIEGHYFDNIGAFEGKSVDQCKGCGLTIVDFPGLVNEAGLVAEVAFLDNGGYQVKEMI